MDGARTMQKAQAPWVLPHFFTSALTLWLEASALLVGMISPNGTTYTPTCMSPVWGLEQSNKE